MKFSNVILSFGLSVATAAAQEVAIGGFPIAQHIPKSLVSPEQKLTPKLRSDAVRTRVRYGPFVLAASNVSCPALLRIFKKCYVSHAIGDACSKPAGLRSKRLRG